MIAVVRAAGGLLASGIYYLTAERQIPLPGRPGQVVRRLPPSLATTLLARIDRRPTQWQMDKLDDLAPLVDSFPETQT